MRPDMPSTLEDHLDAFDAAWQQPVPPRPEDFLPPRSDPVYHEVLVGLVSIDLERRIKAREQVRVEDYLRRFPELREGDTLLELVLLERDLRRRHDPACNLAEYPARFPELAAQLETPLHTVIVAPVAQGTGQESATEGGELDLRDHVLLDLVGRGGMGEVYRGRDPALARNLAVKVLRPDLRGHPEAERRFHQEARINGVLQHPSIVPVHNLGRLPDGRLYFTMKLVRGQTLAELLNVGPGLQTGPTGPAALPRHLREGLSSAGLRPQPQGHPPRPEADQHHGRGLRRSAGHGLGTGQGPIASDADADAVRREHNGRPVHHQVGGLDGRGT
jgi:hypothetical protein